MRDHTPLADLRRRLAAILEFGDFRRVVFGFRRIQHPERAECDRLVRIARATFRRGHVEVALALSDDLAVDHLP